MLYDQITAKAEIRAIAKELQPSLQCTIAYDRRKTMRATIVIDFNTATKAARSTFAWAKGRFGGALTGVAVAERTVVAASTDRMDKFEAGEGLIDAYVGDARHSLWRGAADRITVLDS